jgi:hypothetical protein
LGLLLIGAPPAARAAVFPEALNYQGRMRLTSGAAVVDSATHVLTAKLYTTAAAGTPIWQETISGVSTVNGLFNVQLGNVTSLSSLAWDQPYFLGISFDGDPEMTPRNPLAMAPYAYRAKYADVSLPLSGSTTVSLPAGGVDITALGTGYAIKGTATQAGMGSGSNITITAGVVGETSALLSAGVIGYSSLTSQQGAGVYGIGPVGVKGDSQLSGGFGGDFDDDFGTGVQGRGLTGVAASANGSGSVAVVAQNQDPAGQALQAWGYSSMTGNRQVAPILRVEQDSSAPGSGAIEAYSYASGTAAIRGVNYDGNPPSANQIPGVGLYGEGTVGVVGWTNAIDGLGIVAHASGGTNSVGLRAENQGSGGEAIDAQSDNGTAIHASGTNGLQAYSTAPTGGTGVYAYANPSGTALHVDGNAQFNNAGSTSHTYFNGYVDFTGASVTGLPTNYPLIVTGSDPMASITGEDTNPSGTGVFGKNMTGGFTATGVMGQVYANGANAPIGVLGSFSPSPIRPTGGAAVLGDASGPGTGWGVYGIASGSGPSTAGLHGGNKVSSGPGSPALALDLDGGIGFSSSTRPDKPADRVTVSLGGCSGNNPTLANGLYTVNNSQVTTNSVILVSVISNGGMGFPVTARADSVNNGSFNIVVHAIGQGSICPGLFNVDVAYLILYPH